MVSVDNVDGGKDFTQTTCRADKDDVDNNTIVRIGSRRHDNDNDTAEACDEASLPKKMCTSYMGHSQNPCALHVTLQKV